MLILLTFSSCLGSRRDRAVPVPEAEQRSVQQADEEVEDGSVELLEIPRQPEGGGRQVLPVERPAADDGEPGDGAARHPRDELSPQRGGNGREYQISNSRRSPRAISD